MDLLKKYLLENVHRSPDDPVAPVADPVVDPAVVAAIPAADPEPPVDPDPQGDPPPAADHGNKGKKPWFLDRISEEASARRAAEERATNAETLLQRLQNGKPDPAAPVVPTVAPQDFQTAVRSEAARIKLSEDSTAIRDNGLKEFGSAFTDSLNILSAVGATADDVVLDLIAVDKANAHKILATLAKDPEKAAALAGMDPRRRTAELTRMSMSALAPAADPAVPPKPAVPAKQVSRAPAPPPPVDPNASKVTDWRSDEASDDEFDRGFKETMAKRSARR